MICKKCGQDKLPIDFSWKSNGMINGGQRCLSCLREIDNLPENKKRAKDLYLQRKYGITSSRYEEILKLQEGKCALCKRENKGKSAFHVDHCHTTGKVRGLLCNQCNPAIGFLNEDLDRIYKVIDYLNLHKLVEGR